MTNYNLVFGQVSGNVKISLSPKVIGYTVNATIDGGTLVGSLPPLVDYGSNFSITIDANSGYELASSGVTVTGATFDRISEDTSQEITRYQVFFNGVTGNVNIIITLEALPSGDELLGTWVFNEELTASSKKSFSFDVTFTSNLTNYTQLDADSEPNIDFETFYIDLMSYYKGNESDYAITAGQWENNAYRTITITDTSSLTNRAEFTEWLKANAVKQ